MQKLNTKQRVVKVRHPNADAKVLVIPRSFQETFEDVDFFIAEIRDGILTYRPLDITGGDAYE